MVGDLISDLFSSNSIRLQDRRIANGDSFRIRPFTREVVLEHQTVQMLAEVLTGNTKYLPDNISACSPSSLDQLCSDFVP